MPMEQSSSMGRVLFSWFSGEYKGTEVQVSSRKEKEKKRINLFLITEGQHVGTAPMFTQLSIALTQQEGNSENGENCRQKFVR